LTVNVEGVAAQIPVKVVALPAALEVVAGAGQRAMVGGTLPQQVTVRLVSSRGKPIAGEGVRFRTSDGRGGAEPALVVTDALGRARTSWTLGELPGRQRLIATNEHLDSTATVIAEADPVGTNTRTVSLHDALTARVGETADTVAVRVTDSVGRALADVPVSWSTVDGGRIVALGERTDSLGEARARWSLGHRVGVQHATVHLGSGRSVPALAITARAVAAKPSVLVLESASAQQALVNAALPKPVIVQVSDAFGNAVGEARLTARVNGGVLADTLFETDSNGTARIGWTMPRAAGDYKLVVRLDGVSKSVQATAIARAAAPANLAFLDAPTDGTAGRVLGKAVSVRVTDVYGNAVSGAVVSFRPAAGSVAPQKIASDAAGVARARWTLGTRLGEQSLSASVGASARAALSLVAAGSRHAELNRRRQRS
jgi:hypothetical protein